MTTLTDTQVITASGGLVELGYTTKTSTTTISNTYAGGGNDMGLSLTVVCDGGPVMVEFYCPSVTCGSTSGDGAGAILKMDGTEQAVMGALTGASNQQVGDFKIRLTPSAGSHTFTVMGYKIGTGSAQFAGAGSGAGTYQPLFLRVSKIVQATQWPAVTTGTIICTSSTRPSAPFEGQRIYETDTNKEWVYDGAAWYSPGLQREEKNTSQVTVTTAADVTGMTTGSNFTAVSGRKYRATFYCSQAYGTAGERMAVTLLSGSTTFQAGYFGLSPSTGGSVVCITGTFTASGVTTVKVRASRDIGTNNAFLYADANSPLTLTVEDIGPA